MPDEITTAETAETAESTNEPESTTQETSTSETLTPPPELQAVIDKERQNAREAEKARKAIEKELADLRKKSMSETEKAIDEARSEGRRQALTEAGSKVAAAEFRAAATGRMTAEQVDTLIDGINLSRYVGEDGEIDRESIVKFVDGIAPQPTEDTSTTVLDLGQGARGAGQNAALNGDPLLRSLKDKLGITG